MGAHAAASAPDRRLLGAASAYPADGMLAARTDELEMSQRARRAAAWEAVARVVAPITLAEPVPLEGATVPRFRTWHDADDVTRIFEHAYEALDAEGRAAHARIADAAIDAAFDWDQHVLDGMPSWTDAAWAAYLERFADGRSVASIGGLSRIALSPDATRHIVASYPDVLRCRADGSPPAFVDGPTESTTGIARERVQLDRCSSVVRGPYWAAAESRIAARLEGAGSSVATVRVLSGATPETGIERCSATTETSCDVSGPGPFLVEVDAGGLWLNATLVVERTTAQGPVACLDGPFPLASATVSEEWRRVELGRLPTYDTSATALSARLADGDGTWGPGDGSAVPAPDQIYTLSIASGATFYLAGMHIRTRELDHWLNITLWWTARPGEDFGADMPSSVRNLRGPWWHYAMCVAIDDVERDPDPTGGVTDPSLAAALAAVHDGQASWCSNPYIDSAPGLVRSNCVGCHQHAMSGVRPGEVVMDETRYPSHGRLLVRNNFPADQFWGLDAGDNLATMIQDTVDYWSTAPPP